MAKTRRAAGASGGQPYPGLGDKAVHLGETSLWAMRGHALHRRSHRYRHRRGHAVLTKVRGDEMLRKLGALCQWVIR